MNAWACNWHPEPRFDTLDGFETHMDAEHLGWRFGTTIVPCPTCDVGSIWSTLNVGLIGPRCMHCPALECDDCGEPDDRKCSCWVSIESLSLADKKALFAADGTFNIGSNGEVTVG